MEEGHSSKKKNNSAKKSRVVVDEETGFVRKKQKLSRAVKKTLAKKKLSKEKEEIEALCATIASQPPALDGRVPEETSAETHFAASLSFDQLPISKATKTGLKQAKFEKMTAIQRAAIPQALAGRNVIGTAKTGSGKTLAFLIPLVERLYREQWTRENGVGAIVVSPTRELAMQTFEVLKLVAANHKLHGGLMIGRGMDLQEERRDASTYSIIIATPGRLLQHLDEAYDLKTDLLQMIVFDECDRLLDMGFEKTIDAILGHLPPISSGVDHGLQCLMFSATNNKKLVSDRIRETDFVDVDPHRESNATPNSLRHLSMNVTLDKKMTMLWSFIKQHMFSKMMVFVASCKQARYLEEVMRRLQAAPAWIAAIHGRLQQTKRMAKYYEFRKLKHGILICTDVAARGLDFPAVDWVIQMDVPESVDSYIHRVGRTARLGGSGSALMFVMPSESSFVNKLAQRGIVLENVEPKTHRLEDPSPQIEALLAQDTELRYLAQKAFVCYMRSVNLSSDKEMFDVTKLPYREYSQSLGLITVPKIKFGKSQRTEKNAPFALQNAGVEKKSSKTPVPRIEKLINRQPQRKSLAEPLAGEEDADDFLVLQRVDHGLEEAAAAAELSTGKRLREEEGVDNVDQETALTAKERRNQRRLAEKKARKEKMRQKKLQQAPEQQQQQEQKELPKSVQDREALALELLAKADF